MFYTNAASHKGKLLVRGFTDSGKRFSNEFEMQPEVFLHGEGEFKDLFGKSLKKLPASDWYSTKQKISDYEKQGIDLFYNRRLEMGELNRIFKTQKTNIDLIRVAVVDIETTVEHGDIDTQNTPETINAVSVRSSHNNTTVCFALHRKLEIDYKTVIPGDNNVLVFCETEEDLLRSFINHWNMIDPDVMTGWNVETFDVPYLINRITKILGTKSAERLSPWGIVEHREFTSKFGEENTYDIVGISVIDLLPTYKKFRKNSADSWKLSAICMDELGLGKLEDGGHLLYKTDFAKFIGYNIRDVELVELLNRKTKLIELLYMLAYGAGVNYKDTFQQVKMWDAICCNSLYAEGIIPMGNRVRRGEGDPGMVGGFVMEPRPGLYEDVIVFDVTSEYPSLIIQFNMSPETLVRGRERAEILGRWHRQHKEAGRTKEAAIIAEFLAGKKLGGAGTNAEVDAFIARLFECECLVPPEEKEFTMTPKGVIFSLKKQGFLPRVLDQRFQQRASIKKLMLQKESELEELIKLKKSL